MTQWFSLKHFFRRGVQREASLWLPPGVEEDATNEDEGRSISPLAAPVHVQSGSAVVRIESGVLLIEREAEPRFERPIELVSAVHIHGPATITSPCVIQLIAQGTPILWRSPSGYPIGYAGPMHAAGLDVRRAQYAAVGTAAGLAVAQALVAAKIVNMRGLVRRRAALAGRECLDRLAHQSRHARGASTINTLLGLEGAATAQYFAAWPSMISARAGDLTLDTRTRRPPQDEINAMLSYAYAVLAGECLTACAAAGLDARQGFLHRPRAGRPALALDLMEPFRPVIADQAVLSGLNNGQLKSDHFRLERHKVLMTDEGRRLALCLIEQRLLGVVTLENRAAAVTWRAAIGLSARALADSLKSGADFLAVERS
jgi:CRISP-associated protein Cas1